MPPAILTWCSALSHVITNPGWVVYKMTTADTGYAFPDLGLFIAVIIAEKQMMYFINWLKYQDTSSITWLSLRLQVHSVINYGGHSSIYL
jgi:hypothetical protein